MDKQLNASPWILHLTVKCLSGCCWQNIKALQWFWSAIFVVGCYDLTLGGGALSLCMNYIFWSCALLKNSGSLSFFKKNKETNTVLIHLSNSTSNIFTKQVQTFLVFFSLGGTYKESYWEIVQNCKHVWGVCKSRRSSSALQFQGDEQGIKMYHSDARQHYK